MSLAIAYCKELSAELRQTAVYIPGEAVLPGDIITFDEGNIFGPKALGPFQKVTSLGDLDINLEVEDDKNPHSYVYASKGAVSVSFNAGADAGNLANGKLAVNFSKEGATYLSAVDCTRKRFGDISELETLLEPHKGTIDWKSCFIVIGVTTATKALIMQSNSSSASLEVQGQVKGLQPIPGAAVLDNNDINANINLKITSYKEASFIKDWSANVPIFFQLVRYKKKFLGGWNVKRTRNELINHPNDSYSIDLVDPFEEIR